MCSKAAVLKRCVLQGYHKVLMACLTTKKTDKARLCALINVDKLSTIDYSLSSLQASVRDSC